MSGWRRFLEDLGFLRRVSSFHLWWEEPPSEPVVAVSVTLEVVEAPSIDRLYFWAVQASFTDGTKSFGGAHLGLQWNPAHPDSRAVNWGGYPELGQWSAVMDGSASPLPSKPSDPNTRDFSWQPGVPYRLRISRSDIGWRGEVDDTVSGEGHLIRDLLVPGDRLTSAVMWSEVFAPCDAPSAMVRWTRPEWETTSGSVTSPTRVRATFPASGDCPNTEVGVDASGVWQRTNTRRTHRDGDVLVLPA
ncbi:MAG TPA: hypothetical protein VK461_06550 [Acidimicrobiales bacterium]|nr:hypothetical protein [Acidimicrobiales bacterium]